MLHVTVARDVGDNEGCDWHDKEDLAEVFKKLMDLGVDPRKENDELSIVDGSLERLSKLFLICLRAITNTETGLALRDVCYRVCCIIVTISSRPGRPTSSQQVLDKI